MTTPDNDTNGDPNGPSSDGVTNPQAVLALIERVRDAEHKLAGVGVEEFYAVSCRLSEVARERDAALAEVAQMRDALEIFASTALTESLFHGKLSFRDIARNALNRNQTP